MKSPGSCTVLQGERTLEQELQQVPGYDCLRVLGAGVLPPNPAELLNGPKARQVFATLRENFDLVLVDSPPVLPVTDAMVLSTYADGTLVVVAAGQTRQAALHRTAERFAQAKAPLVGIVLNQVTKENGYGYGYGYGIQRVATARTPRAASGFAGVGQWSPGRSFADVGQWPPGRSSFGQRKRSHQAR